MNVRFERYLETLTKSKRDIACEAVSEYLKGDAEDVSKFVTASAVYTYCRSHAMYQEEHSWVLLLKANYSLIKEVELCSGTVKGTMFDVQAILREALFSKAQGVIMVHNHPSGSITPSREDNEITITVQKACDLLNIKLTDHVIICNGNYYSYAEEGKL